MVVDADSAPPLQQARGTRESVVGTLHRSRSGLVRALLLITGVALLRWIGLALATLLGYRHVATLRLNATSLELQGERSFFGLSLGSTHQLVPFAAVRRVAVVGHSPLWAVFAALAALVSAAVLATVLVMWGIAGRQASWVLLGVAVIGAGLLLDAAAYLWVRRGVARGLATLELHADDRRYRLSGASGRALEKLLAQLRDLPGAPAKPRPPT
jgi:hypothetical protein